MKLTDQQRKLVLLAFDQSAATGEVSNAAMALINSLRKEYKDGHEFIKARAGNGAVSTSKPIEGVNYGNVVLTFGKYNGKMLKEVDPGYLLWAVDSIKPERINKYTLFAMKRFLRDEHYRN